ncbi:MAG: radical SAM/SPASM domain-containing protein [bacterium]
MPDNIFPLDRIHIELTNRCNFSCSFCPNSQMTRPIGNMDFGLLVKILDEISGYNLARVVLFHLMGEPLCYPDLIEAVKYAAKKGLNVYLSTNGSLLDENNAYALMESGLSRLILSLQTPDDMTFKSRLSPLSFEEYKSRLISIVKMIMKAPYSTEVRVIFLATPWRFLFLPAIKDKTVVVNNSSLQSYLKEWFNWLVDEDALEERQREKIYRVLGKTKGRYLNHIQITDRLFFETRILGDWGEKKIDKKRYHRARIGYCPALREHFGILWNGDIVFCCTDFNGDTAVSNINRTTIREYYKKEFIHQVIQGFHDHRVLAEHCQYCLGGPNLLHKTVRQIGSIFYFKLYRKYQDHCVSCL